MKLALNSTSTVIMVEPVNFRYRAERKRAVMDAISAAAIPTIETKAE